MTTILYVDTAADRFAQRGKDAPPWEPHMVRLALIHEVDGEEHSCFITLVMPEDGWEIDRSTYPYHKINTIGDLVDGGRDIGDVVRYLLIFLADCDLIVSHNWSFHRKVLGSAFVDAGAEQPAVWPNAFDTMGGSADIVQVRRMPNGQWKPPTLKEAYKHFTEADMPDHPGWLDHANQQVEAVRVVYHGIQKERQGVLL